MKNKNIVLDAEEKELWDSFENNEWQTIKDFEQEKNIAQNAASNCIIHKYSAGHG